METHVREKFIFDFEGTQHCLQTLVEELHEKRKQESKLKERVESMKGVLRSRKKHLEEIVCKCKELMTTQRDGKHLAVQALCKTRDELQACTAKLIEMEESKRQLENEKISLEQELKELRETKEPTEYIYIDSDSDSDSDSEERVPKPASLKEKIATLEVNLVEAFVEFCNCSSLEELVTLKGVGKSRASKIIGSRKEKPFETLEDMEAALRFSIVGIMGSFSMSIAERARARALGKCAVEPISRGLRLANTS